METIACDRLKKTYGKNRGIESVDLHLKSGDFMGFIGPNGAGKSTTIRLLLGLISPDAGSLSILGKDPRNPRERKEILQQTGYLPSEVPVYPGMKVKDLLKLTARLHKTNCDRQADELCKRLNLDPERSLEELSLGNRKKAGIVCALQHDPALLILDEPTSGLDPLIQKEFFALLRERNQQGVTILLSSHQLTEVQKHCQKAAFIKEGRIIACDSVEKLMKSQTRRIHIIGSFQPQDDPELMEHIQDLRLDSETENSEKGHTEENGWRFLYSGDINLLLQKTAGHVKDLLISEPDLEELFLHRYSQTDQFNKALSPEKSLDPNRCCGPSPSGGKDFL